MKGDDLDQSLDAHSQFLPIQAMGESLIATSEKIFFQNASTINREDLEKDRKLLAPVGDHPPEEQSLNQFLEVSKWKKNKESTMHREMANVKKQVDEIITQTRWRKKEPVDKLQHKTEKVADETGVPNKKEEQEEEIEDQTQREEEQQEEGEDEDEEEEEQEDEEEQEQEEEQQEEQEESEEQSDEQQEEEGEEMDQEEYCPPKEIQHSRHEHHCEASHLSSKSPISKSKVSKSSVSYDDKTDTQSQMKRTEYLPTKWSKKSEGDPQKQEAWKRKEAILLRIAMLVQ